MEQAVAECSHISKWHDVMTEMLGKVQIFDNYNNQVLVHAKHNCQKHRTIRMVEWCFVPFSERPDIRAMKCWICAFWPEE